MRPRTCGLRSSFDRAQRAKVPEFMACFMVSELYLTETNCENRNSTLSSQGREKKTHDDEEFESLTIPQGSLRPYLPSLESVVTA